MFMDEKIKAIIRQIGDLGEKVSRLEAGKSLPSIELDIILEKIRSLYEEVRDLQSATSIPALENPSETEDNTAEKKNESIPVNNPPEKIKAAPETPRSEPGILAEKYQGEKKFINESLADKGGKQNIGSKIQSKPIRNIGSALGINDRFKLIKDLFNGDKASYENTINILDGASNFNEAFTYINSSFDWDMEEESVHLLLELVRRKFIVNQNE